MVSIKQFMTHDHRECDDAFAKLEGAVADGDWQLASSLYLPFFNAFERHFKMEEEILFPAFEEKTGSSEGPTQVMRMEHAQIRRVMFQMEEAIKQQERERFLGLSETFMILTQQHNMKEEQILYTMAEGVLSNNKERILEAMKQIKV